MPMDCLDIVGVVTSPRPSHTFGLDVCELKHKVADWQDYALNRAL